MLRVYVLAPSYPPAVGGQESHLQELAEHLSTAGVGVQVIVAARELPGVEHVDTVPVVRLCTFGRTQGGGWRSIPWIVLLLFRVIWRLVYQARRYDVVLVSGFNVMPLAPVVAAILTRKPCVVRPESPLELKHAVGETSRSRMGLPSNSLLLRFLMALRRMAAHRVDRYIAISAEIRAKLVADGIDPQKIVAISNGINVDRFVPASADVRIRLRTALNLPADKLLLIYTGRLAVSKGVNLLMETWGEIALRRPDAHLVLVGTGAESLDDCEPGVRQYVNAHGLEDRVCFAGNVPNVHEYLQAADIFVFPSFYEGFGLSILEAMAVGLPMVCTRVGVAAELAAVPGVGLIVRPRDRQEFTIALERLLGDAQLRKQSGINARNAVQGRFSMSIVARHHADLFSELVGQRSH